MKQREGERTGLTEAEARIMSHRDMGNITLAREYSREVWIASWFEGLVQNVRYDFGACARSQALPLPPALLTRPDYCCSRLAGRLAPGVPREQARAELELLSRQYRAQWGDQR
jgi:hypothetical protein